MNAARTRWRLIWRDEFDGDTIDPAKWDFDIGNGFHDASNHAWIPGWGNEELQYYTRDPANAFVRESVLHIRALKEALHGCAYTSARLKTRRRRLARPAPRRAGQLGTGAAAARPAAARLRAHPDAAPGVGHH